MEGDHRRVKCNEGQAMGKREIAIDADQSSARSSSQLSLDT
jgi:hypothetical protein